MASTIVVSYSELDTARQCLHKHDLAYRQRWQSPTTGAALTRGTLWHAVMAQHYQTIKIAQDNGIERPNAQDLAVAVAPLMIPQVGKPTDDQELIRWMYEGYVSQWGTDEDWFVMAVEHPAVFWLPTDRGGRSRFQLKVKIDLIVRWKGKLWIVDHKSGARLPTEKMLEIDDQFGLYTWGLQRMGRKVAGQIHNAARTQRNQDPSSQPLKSRFLRTPLYRTDRELAVIAVEAYQTARIAWGDNGSPRSPDPDRCGWRCDYTDACLHGRKKGDDAERGYLLAAGYRQDFTRH